MSEANKNTAIRLLIDIWRDGKFDVLPEICHADVQRRHSRLPASGFDEYRTVVGHYRAAFTELVYDLHSVIVDGDRVAIRYTVSGHHTGAFGPIPATGLRSSIECIDWYRFRDGKIAEIWTQFDEFGLLMKLGVIKA